jgi:O-antigen/teichoic acid export membrane protein
MSGQTHGVLTGRIVGLGVNGVVAVVLIPTYGATGAAIAMGAGIVVWNVVMLFMAVAHCGFNPSLAGFVLRNRAAPVSKC